MKGTKMNYDQIATFATRNEAQKLVDRLNSGTYYLAHGEYARPDYTVRKVRGGDRYYIHARRHYYAGTFYAGKSGALTEHVVAGYSL
jgi:hypothetical protein